MRLAFLVLPVVLVSGACSERRAEPTAPTVSGPVVSPSAGAPPPRAPVATEAAPTAAAVPAPEAAHAVQTADPVPAAAREPEASPRRSRAVPRPDAPLRALGAPRAGDDPFRHLTEDPAPGATVGGGLTVKTRP